MSARHKFWPLKARMVLMILGAIFIAWAWYAQKANSTAAPDEPPIERLYS